MVADKNPDRPTRALHSALLLLTLFAALPLAFELTPVVFVIFGVVLALRGIFLWRGHIRASRWLLVPLTIAAFLLVFSQYHTILGRDAGTSLLMVMLGLKTLEGHTVRDLYVSCFLGFFLIAAQFLFFQEIPVVAYLLVVTGGYLALLAQVNRVERRHAFGATAISMAVITAQAIPIAVLLFLLFPRLPGPLWGFYAESGAAKTGFSDRLSPGSVSRLSQSDEVAFRVDFDGPAPSPSRRYWRGQVFWNTDGRQWTFPAFGAQRTSPLEHSGLGTEEISYTITLEPHNDKWLFALDLPATVPQDARIRKDFQILSDKPVRDRYRYSVTSHLRYDTGALSPEERRWGLQIPPNVTERLRELAAQWKSSATDGRSVVNKALLHFHQENFVYTLRPPLLAENPIDEFMFETRTGFCEHYATSFVVLMRLAGIPSRVVTGYQGGERNPIGNYFIVRQSDAHAWAEVWLEDSGWTRIDPTAAVAPERIERGIGIDTAEFSVEGVPVRFRVENLGFFVDLARSATFVVDAINMGWYKWVINFSTERQQELLSSLGLSFLRDYGKVAALALVVTTFVAAVAWILASRNKPKADPGQRLYEQICKRLSRQRLDRYPHEGPLAYASRVGKARPDLRPAFDEITRAYIGLRYRGLSSRKNIRRFRLLAAMFRP